MTEWSNSPTRKRDDIIVGRAHLPERERGGGWAVPGGHAIYERPAAINYAVRMDALMSERAKLARLARRNAA